MIYTMIYPDDWCGDDRQGTVSITDSRGRRHHVNPPEMVHVATGHRASPYWCIPSFVLGLQDGGHEIVCNIRNQRARRRELRSFMTDKAVPLYYFVGRLWGSKRWDEHVRRLQRLQPEDRWNALFQAAEQCFRTHRSASFPTQPRCERTSVT